MGFWSGMASLASAAVGKIKNVASAAVGKIKSVAKACWRKTKSMANAFWKKIRSAARFLWSKIMSIAEITAAVVAAVGVVAFGIFSLLRFVIPGFGLMTKVLSTLQFGRRIVQVVLFGFIYRGGFGEGSAQSYERQRRERLESFASDLLVLCLSFLFFWLFGF